MPDNLSKEAKDDSALENWVYMEPRQRLTFDGRRINAHGTTHLSRSLSSRKLIAVLGSGLSRSYGQPSWSALLRNTASIVGKELTNYRNSSHRPYPHLASLIDRFSAAGLTTTLQKTEDVIINFELCDNLYSELHVHRLERANVEVRSRTDEVFKARAYLRARLKWQLTDDRGRVEILLSDKEIVQELKTFSDLVSETYRAADDAYKNLEGSENHADAFALYESALKAYERARDSDLEDVKRRPVAPLMPPKKWQTSEFFDEITKKLSYPGRPGDSNISDGDDAYAALFAMLFYKDVRNTEELVRQVARENPENLRVDQMEVWTQELRSLRRFESEFFKHHFQIESDGHPSIHGEGEHEPDPIVKFVHQFDVDDDPTARAHWDLHDTIDAAFANMSARNKLKYLRAIHKLSQALSLIPALAKDLTKRARARHPAHLDPISILHKELGIRRFVTMNYDAEVDKWLECLGFEEIAVRKDTEALAAEHGTAPATHGSRSIMVDRFNNHAEILAYEPGSAPDLFAFGVDTRDADIRVLHMHGRIRKAESWLVLSEPDYQARYARDDDPHAQSDDAMRLIFNANPLLFVGLGMTEADVLKPLRAYNQNEVSLSDRPSIALLPRLRKDDAILLEQSKAMSAYGIFNLYYGAGRVREKEGTIKQMPSRDVEPASKTAEPDEGLCLMKLRDAVDALRAFVATTGWPETTDEDTRLKRREDLVDAAKKAWAAVGIVRRDCFDLTLERAVIRKFVTIEGSKVHALTVNYGAKQLLLIANAVLPHEGQLEHTTSDMPAAALVWKDRIALDCLLQGIGNTFFTSFFCARLKAVVDDHRQWQENWGVASKPREKYGKAVVKDATSGDPLPLFDANDCAVENIRQIVILRDLEAEERARLRPLSEVTETEHGEKPHEDGRSAVSKDTPFEPPAAPLTDRFFAGHPSPAIITLRVALSGLPDMPPNRKRLFLFLGARGEGRGHVFAAMRSPKRFAHLCDWLKIRKDEVDSTEPSGIYPTDKAARSRTKKIPRAFYNLGLSHEVISVFDRMINFLQDILFQNMNKEEGAAFLSAMRTIQSDRVKRFSVVLEKLHSCEGMPNTNRIIICINNIDKLFNEHGRAKNAQIERLVQLLFDAKSYRTPIDFIFFMNHTPLPRILKDMSEQQPFHALCADTLTPGNAKQHSDFLDRLDVSWVNADLGRPPKSADAGYVFIHKLHAMRPITFALRFFPKVAFALYYLGEKTNGGRLKLNPQTDDSLVNYTFKDDIHIHKIHQKFKDDWPAQSRWYDNLQEFLFPRNLYLQKSLRDAFDSVLTASNRSTADLQKYARVFSGNSIDKIALELIRDHLVKRELLKVQELNLQDLHLDIERIRNGETDTPDIEKSLHEIGNTLHSVRKEYEDDNMNRMIGLIKGLLGESLTERVGESDQGVQKDSPGSARAAMPEQWLPEDDPTAYYFYELYRAVGRNRYCLTLVIAAIDDMIERRLNSFPEGLVELHPIIRFIERLNMACASLSPVVRVEMAVAHVLLNYKTDVVNSYATPMSAWPQTFTEQAVLQKAARSEDYVDALFSVENSVLFNLQETILATLSLIGQPVTAATLLGVEGIAAAFAHLFRAMETDPKFSNYLRRRDLGGGCKAPITTEQKRDCVNIVMDLLVHRCLAFRLFPKNDPAKNEYHFTVHSAIKRYYLSNMNAHNVDYATIDQLTVSIYSSQPNDMPKPSAETNRRIRHLIEGLSRYENHPYHAFEDPFLPDPKPGNDEAPSSNEDRNERTDIARGRLRAAFGALRSFYSVAVVSRFSSYQDEGIHPPELGYLEIHRRRVRWLLRKAYALDNPDPRQHDATKPPAKSRDEDNGDKVLYTFYAEEQVWMYNECGVVSLAQGRIGDAVALFIQAKRIIGRYIESLGWGALHAAVDLNLAVAKIDCGGLREARQLLSRIQDDESETSTMRALARGYLGWIKGLQGDLSHAEVQLNDAVEVLTREEMFRAAAILQIHRADVLTQLGKPRFAEAERVLMSARSLSANGGHEDVRQLSLLAYYRLLTAQYDGGHDRRKKELVRQGLEPLKKYADIMNMPRISGGVALVEAQLFLNEGENATASDAAQRALLIATKNNLELLKIDAMYVLGSALLREDVDEARGLLIRARELAIHCEYNSKINALELALSGLPQEAS